MPVKDALIIAASGIAVVFLMLCMLWLAIVLIDKVNSFLDSFRRVHGPIEVTSEPARQFAIGEEEPRWRMRKPFGSKPKAEEKKAAEPEKAQQGTWGGELLLNGVDEKTAACLMAIVCDQTKIPLNELVFKSIRAID